MKREDYVQLLNLWLMFLVDARNYILGLFKSIWK